MNERSPRSKPRSRLGAVNGKGKSLIARRNAQFQAIDSVAAAINEQFGLVPLLDRALDAVMEATELSGGYAHLLDDEEERLVLVTHRGLEPVETDRHIDLGEGLIGRAAVAGDLLIMTKKNDGGRISVHPERPIGAMAAVPLIARGRVRGVISFYQTDPRQFTGHEKEMLSVIGRQLGVGLEQSRLLEEIDKSHREWEQTFDALADGLAIHSPSGRIRLANRSLGGLFGSPPAALVGMRCCELYREASKPLPNCTIMKTVNERRGQRVEIQETGRVLRLTTDPIITADGKVKGVVCLTRDVTEEKLIERRLIHQERISAVGELAAGIAHEIGTPLNIISANVEYLIRHHGLLNEESSQPGIDGELIAIRDQVHNITRLIRQLLNFARDQSPAFVPLDINDLIERTLELLAHRLNQAQIHCQTNLAANAPSINGDAVQLQQVLFNLIANARQAIEASEQESGLLRISTAVSSTQTDDRSRPHVLITITDDGPGIPEDILPHVFNPFFTANKEGGTGLGLAICQQIVQRHYGSMTIDNASPHGAIVKIYLPYISAFVKA
jgi:two-component system, NtrC family, sensor kinase